MKRWGFSTLSICWFRIIIDLKKFWNDINPEKALKFTPFLILLAIIIGTSISLLLKLWNLDSYIPLIIEITSGTVIAWIVFLYAKKWDRNIRKTIAEIQSTVIETKKQQDIILDLIKKLIMNKNS